MKEFHSIKNLTYSHDDWFDDDIKHEMAMSGLSRDMVLEYGYHQYKRKPAKSKKLTAKKLIQGIRQIEREGRKISKLVRPIMKEKEKELGRKLTAFEHYQLWKQVSEKEKNGNRNSKTNN